MIKLKELKSILDELGINVVYDDFQGSKELTPHIPFISYFVEKSTPTAADNVVFSESVDVMIELYTNKKDLALENKLKKILTKNGIYYESQSSSNPEKNLHIEYIQINILL